MMLKRSAVFGGISAIFVAAQFGWPAAAQTEQQLTTWCDNEDGNVTPDNRITGCTGLILAERQG